MTAVRVKLFLEQARRSFIFAYSINHFDQKTDNVGLNFVSTRSVSYLRLTKNLELISNDKISPTTLDKQVRESEEKPLAVLLPWMLARRKDIFKYAHFYLNQGFDVLSVSSTPWQLLWPSKGTQLIAGDLVKFLDKNVLYQPLVIHGFSIGGYLMGEILVKLAQDEARYKHIIDRFVAQVWDSAVDITEFVSGFPAAVFPKNPIMQAAFKKYLMYHMKAFNKVATVHYVRSSQMFHTNLIRAPALFLISKTDPIGTELDNFRVRESWESLGIKVTWKCWDKSPHVSHYYYHKEEYISELCKHLSNMDLLRYPEKIKTFNK